MVILKEYANLTDDELEQIKKVLNETFIKLREILNVKVEDMDAEQINADYLYWLCFSVGMFRENQFMIDTFGGKSLLKTRELSEKIKDVNKAYQ